MVVKVNGHLIHSVLTPVLGLVPALVPAPALGLVPVVPWSELVGILTSDIKMSH